MDKYTWTDLGSSYVLSDLLAAYLLAQLEARPLIHAKRARLWRLYAEHLSPWAAKCNVALPFVPPECIHPAHLFYLILPTAAARGALISELKARGIHAVFHYLPLHLSGMGQRFRGRPGDCPVAEDLSERLIRLPFYNDLSDDQAERVVEAVCAFIP